MLRFLIISFFIINTTINSHEHGTSIKWPFELVDELINNLKHNIEVLEESAVTNKFVEESLNVKEFDPVAALEHAEIYDFIIVGGGTSGAILASRLSEVPEWKILLLEAGGYETEATQVPQNWRLLANTPFNWGFTTTPQNYSCLAMEDHKCSIPSGRVLGGTSSINSMLYTRGNSHDFDIWADKDNIGWCANSTLKYFKKIENLHNIINFDHKYHHYGGKQNLENPQYLTELSKYLIEACHEIGLKHIDYNGHEQYGVSLVQLMTEYGKRASTAQSYLKTCLKRPNLIVKTHSQAIKIVLSEHSHDVKGVQYIQGDAIKIAKAQKEVILAAGAVNTPKLLILSGIGSKDQCDSLNIPQIYDLDVGSFLQTHPVFIGLDFIYDEHNQKYEGIDRYHDLVQYLRDNSGQLTVPGLESIAFVKTPISRTLPKYPDIELQFSWKYYTKIDKFQYGRIDEEQYKSIWAPIIDKKGVQITVTLAHPKSHGFLKLKTNDPFHHPIIEPHLLAEHDDIKTLLAGIKLALNLSHSETFQKLGLKLNHHQVHGCEEHSLDSDDYWLCAIKYLTISNGDIWGTCKMGPEEDHTSVVNNKLQVYGIERLRIADSSIIPVPIAGSLTATTMMIAEQAADLIKEKWY